MGVFAWLHAISGVGSSSSRQSHRPAADHASDRQRSTLFQCPECETVYIACEDRRCSNCEVVVERVQSTPTTISESD